MIKANNPLLVIYVLGGSGRPTSKNIHTYDWTYILSAAGEDKVDQEGCAHFMTPRPTVFCLVQLYGGASLWPEINSILLKPEGFIRSERPAGRRNSEMQLMHTGFFSNTVNTTVITYWSSMSFFCWTSDQLSLSWMFPSLVIPAWLQQ